MAKARVLKIDDFEYIVVIGRSYTKIINTTTKRTKIVHHDEMTGGPINDKDHYCVKPSDIRKYIEEHRL
jgi:hypothetical protein